MNETNENTGQTVNRSLLVVDDDQPTARCFKRLLESAGYRVEIAFDGETAIRKFEAIPFDAAILDYRLPDMNGMELLAQLQNVRSNFGCIMLTGNSNLEQEDESSGHAIKVLIKPVDMKLLTQAVEDCLVENANL